MLQKQKTLTVDHINDHESLHIPSHITQSQLSPVTFHSMLCWQNGYIIYWNGAYSDQATFQKLWQNVLIELGMPWHWQRQCHWVGLKGPCLGVNLLSMGCRKGDWLLLLPALCHMPERPSKSVSHVYIQLPHPNDEERKQRVSAAVFYEGGTTPNYQLAVMFSGYLAFGHETMNCYLASG